MLLLSRLIVIKVCLGFLNTNIKCSGLAMKIRNCSNCSFRELMLMLVLLVSLLSVLSDVFWDAMNTKFNPKNFGQTHSGLFSATSDAVIGKQSLIQYTFDLTRARQLTPNIQISHDNPVEVLSIDQRRTVYVRDKGFSFASSEINLSTMRYL